MAWVYIAESTITYTYPITFSKIFTAVCNNREGSGSGGGCSYQWVTAIVGVNYNLGLSALTTVYSYPKRGFLVIGSI